MQARHPKITTWQANRIANSNKPAMRRISLIGLLVFFLATPYALPLDELLPPFGFRWNDSMARGEGVLHGAKAKIAWREKKRERAGVTGGGPGQSGIKRNV